MRRALGIVVVAILAGGLWGCVGTAVKKGPSKRPAVAKAAPKAPVSTLIRLTVQGADYPTLSAFKKKLQAVPGVKKIYQQSFSAEQASLLQVEYIGAAQSLADAIQALSAEEMPIEVLGFDPTTIEIRIGGGT